MRNRPKRASHSPGRRPARHSDSLRLPVPGLAEVDGGHLLREYLRAGLLDEMQLHLVPILLGNGIRLFEGLDPEGIELRRASSIETPSATHFRFEVVK
jgi:dihydrofolate reductase